MEFLHSLSDLVLVGLVIHNEQESVIVFHLPHGRLSGQRELEDGTESSLLLLGVPPRPSGLPQELKCWPSS